MNRDTEQFFRVIAIRLLIRANDGEDIEDEIYQELRLAYERGGVDVLKLSEKYTRVMRGAE